MKFKYSDKVKVISGFYREQIGIIYAYEKSYKYSSWWNKSIKPAYYFIDFSSFRESFKENELELVDEV